MYNEGSTSGLRGVGLGPEPSNILGCKPGALHSALHTINSKAAVAWKPHNPSQTAQSSRLTLSSLLEPLDSPIFTAHLNRSTACNTKISKDMLHHPVEPCHRQNKQDTPNPKPYHRHNKRRPQRERKLLRRKTAGPGKTNSSRPGSSLATSSARYLLGSCSDLGLFG